MVSLSDEDREALAVAFQGSTRSPHHLAFLAEPAVEQIVARHVAAALNEAAEAATAALGHEKGGHTSTYSVRQWLRSLAANNGP